MHRQFVHEPYNCTLKQKEELFPSKFLVWKSAGDLGSCKHVAFDIDDIYDPKSSYTTILVSINNGATCPQKIVATFQSGDSIKTLTTVLNPFPFESHWWSLYPKKYDIVKEIQFHMKDWFNAEGTLKVGLRQLTRGSQWCRTVEKTIKRGY